MRRPDANLQSFTISNQEIIAGRAWVTAVLAGEKDSGPRLNHKQELVCMLKPHLVVCFPALMQKHLHLHCILAS